MSVSGRALADRLATWPAAVALLALSYVAGVSAVAFAPQAGDVAAWWPAAGLAVGLLVSQPRRRWPVLAAAVLVVTALASVSGGRAVGITVLFAVGNALEAVVAAHVLRRGQERPPVLDSAEVLVRLVVAAVLGGAAVTMVAAASALATGADSPGAVARTFFTSHTAATLLIVPALLPTPRVAALRRRRGETAAQVLVVTVLTLLVFAPHQELPTIYAPLPALVWAALRLDLRVLTWELPVFGASVTMMSAAGWGPFGFDHERGAISSAVMGAEVQGYLLCAMLLTVPLAVAVAQRRRLIADLSRSERLTGATLDTTAAMILVTDLYGEVTRVNGATLRLTGFGEDDLVGRAVWDLPFAPPGSTGYPAGLPADPFGQVSRETDIVTAQQRRRRILWNTGYVRDDRNRATHVVLTGTDLTRERRAAGLNRHLLEAAITTALIGIAPDGRITVFNVGAVNLLGHDAQDIVGTPFVDLLDPVQLAEVTAGLAGAAGFARLVADLDEGGESAPQDWTWIDADGERHTVSMTISAVSDGISPRYGYLCVGRDVTEARASQEMLVAALEKERLAVQRMREVDAVKSDFVATVSHELRTPVTSIVGFTEMLEDGTVVAPAPEQRSMLSAIARNGQRLIHLCNDLLALGELDAGDAEFEHGRVDLAAVAREAHSALRGQLAARRLTLRVCADGPVLVDGDVDHLERVVVNLLGNAIKFTEDGGRIQVGVEAIGDEARLEVADTGIGIPEEEQKDLFQRFFRASSAKERAIQGTGLGLSIVDSIVAAHGGRIEVRSAPLAGTTFTVRLPLARD